ncbi:hypothetical protein GGR57DRAFT_486654 [Xylariaceae sp. FL1272]|nr:hypothetical protein GGR57DRAFT_486654 [Xylariaceae sp. FL1272]
MSTLRIFRRGTLLQSISRRPIPRQANTPSDVVTRRSYVAGTADPPPDHDRRDSDLPWLIASVTVTVTGLAYLSYTAPVKKKSHRFREEHPDADPRPHPNDRKTMTKSEIKEHKAAEGKEPLVYNVKPPKQGGMQSLPPTHKDDRDLADNWDERRAAHETVYKDEMITKKNTRAASSASAVPSKRTTHEDPREDPKKGKGEGVNVVEGENN